MEVVADLIPKLDEPVADLLSFLKSWDLKYKATLMAIPLFDAQNAKNLTKKQKIYFAKVFYHIRGHFHNFLWHLGNFSPDKYSKEVIIQNIMEEFGGSYQSHEKLYLNFSRSLGVDLENEFIFQKNYLSFVKEFNSGHLKWLWQHDWDSCWAAFSAYERLDNIDYVALKDFVSEFNLPKEALLFFSVHIHVKHFEETVNCLLPIWNKDPAKVRLAFDFIAKHQLDMWKNLSDEISNYA